MGDPRMTLQTQRVLAVLLEGPLGEHYGLDLSRRLHLPTGSIYPILARLERAGWVDSQWEDIDPVTEGRRPRRYYRLTGVGAERARTVLAQTVRSITPRWGVAGAGGAST
jgi:PadR family transcriptional regulator, regulatory protein PadR